MSYMIYETISSIMMVTSDAVRGVCEYLQVFVNEAVERSILNSNSDTIEEVDLKNVLLQLMLDFN
ncbi:hypothetical protein A3Q56_00971 [Intoshia linei]|uniref:Uncharacterized protein n=1 Tax=Intoshia linei TaxID=1819745 RepID=A0A177BAB5_9BILA|nr:hypothetical protein A3Q56_00971 [Intoshia linei]